MYTALPSFVPHDTLWYGSLSTSNARAGGSRAASSTAAGGVPRGSHGHNPGSRAPTDHDAPRRTPLSILRADENAIRARKAHIRRFGAGWLRPAGVSKTLQGLYDEKAEREEQEAAALREQALADAQQAAAEAEAELQNAELGAGDMGEDEERDLDDDIPEADAEVDPDADADDVQWVDDELEDGLPAEEGEGDYGEGPEAGGAGEGDLELQHDLDDDVPEAGSYQHTETDLEDDSSDGEVIQATNTAAANGASATVVAAVAGPSGASAAMHHIPANSFALDDVLDSSALSLSFSMSPVPSGRQSTGVPRPRGAEN